MVRVLIVEPAGGLWGSERALIDLIESAPDLEIAVCCPPRTPLQAELEKRGVRVLPYFIASLHLKSRSQRLKAALGVLRACLVFRPEVIHVNQSGAYPVALFPATLLGLSIVCHVRIFEDAAYLARQGPALHRLKGLISISGAIEDEIRSFQALSTIPVHRIYDAYAHASAGVRMDSKRAASSIACVGRVVPVKGQEVLLEALTRTDIFPNEVECVIAGVGEDDYVRGLKNIGSSAASVRVQWLGFVREVVPLLQTCRVLACPSHREPLGRVIFEAWDAGAVPVVYAGAGGSAEIVSAARGGILYEEQTPECLARALAAAIGLHDCEVDRLVENGRAWMATHCGREPYGRAITAVLAEAAQP
jgi:glycosyltransferase involved in cell wall biosynthesis